MNEYWQSPRIGSVLIASAFPGRAGAMAYAFAKRGLVPTLVFGAAELAALIERSTFDLVMIDGGLRGIEDAGLVRTVVSRSDAAVLLVGGSEAAADVLAAGAHAHLGCGVSPEEVALREGAAVGLRHGTE